MVTVGMLVCEGILLLIVAILRPFSYLLTNIFLVIGQTMTIGFFASIYALEGMKESEKKSGWGMIGIFLALCTIGVFNLIHSIYLDCLTSAKKNAIVHVKNLV